MKNGNSGLMMFGKNSLPFVAGAVLILAGCLTILILARRRSVGPAAPGFVLTDQQGRPTSLAQFRGKVVVLTFIDPECTQLCPLTTQSMVEAVKMLGPAAASRVQLLGVDINVKKARVADVAAYTRAHELESHWRFLTGSPAQLQSVWNSYHVYVGASATGDLVHEAIIYVIDQDGNERFQYRTPMSYESVDDQAGDLAKGIARLLPGVPPPRQSSGQKAVFNPRAAVRVVPLGPKQQPVVLGGAHPHLMLFFAGWLGQDSQLSKKLATLDSYAAVARQRDWPSPVAVDELTTEPSPAQARRTLATFAATLHTPIIEDTSGVLADGYIVGDLPWFVLTSGSGRVVWNHDGWLSAATLEQDVGSVLTPH